MKGCCGSLRCSQVVHVLLPAYTGYSVIWAITRHALSTFSDQSLSPGNLFFNEPFVVLYSRYCFFSRKGGGELDCRVFRLRGAERFSSNVSVTV